MRQGSADDFGNYYPLYYVSGTAAKYCSATTGNYFPIGTSGQLLLSMTFIKNQISCTPNTGNSGYYYNWPASTAGDTRTSGMALNSICPSGWQLTTNTATNARSYFYLIRSVYNEPSDSSNSSVRLLPISLVRSGFYYDGSFSLRGGYGGYWSLVANGSSGAYYLRFLSGDLSPQFGGGKDSGFSVRCVAR